MRGWLRPIVTLLWKDLVLETRTKDIVLSIFVFSLLVIFIFNFAIGTTPSMTKVVAPGVLWVAFIFGGVLGLTRSFGVESDGRRFDHVLLAPTSRETIFFGKMLSNLIFMLIVELAVFPIFSILFNLSMMMPLLIPIVILSTFGITTVGTVFAAMAVNTRAREVMLPLLFLPTVIPIIIAAVEASSTVLGGAGIEGIAKWLILLGIYDAIFLIVCPMAFNLMVEN